MFRGVATPLDGINSYSAGWSMRQNTNIPDSRAFSLFTLITMLAQLGAVGTYVKIAGATTTVNEKKIYSYK
jgi:hypothetical protein